MTQVSLAPIRSFLSQSHPFDRLSESGLNRLCGAAKLLRYRMGQAVITSNALPAQVVILYQGQVRLVAHKAGSPAPETLGMLAPGAILGSASLIRQQACETAIASTESTCLVIPEEMFRSLMQREAAFEHAILNQVYPSELFELLQREVERLAWGDVDLKALTLQLLPQAIVLNLPKGKTPLTSIDPNWIWLLSSGVVYQNPSQNLGQEAELNLGDRVEPHHPEGWPQIKSQTARLIGVPPFLNPSQSLEDGDVPLIADTVMPTIPYAPEQPPTQVPKPSHDLSLVAGRGSVDSYLACFQMLGKYWHLPFRKDVLQRTIADHHRRMGSLSLQLGGAIADLMGLKAQLVVVPAEAITQLPVPAMLRWQEGFALLYQTSESGIVLAVPDTGWVRLKPKEFAQKWGAEGEVLLLEATPETPQKKFGLSWFVPAVSRYKRVLIEVLLASFFVQLFGLANPLITQLIIDKVIIQNAPVTLNVLGSLLIATAIVEAILGALRTNLFVDTTNRIDMRLGSAVIDHLLRLPLPYFEKRPVGELSTRVNELENIRQFLTGTALTVVLDAVFSVIYIGVMIWYSPLLTVVALATVPLFALITILFAPIMRQQTRTKAERNAHTQSYLVEVMSGIQTVKAQSIELPSRWQWQERYARYIAASFKSVQTSTLAGSISKFLNQLSTLLLLWVGAYLVLDNKLTLGQLIAFRIIAGYTTSPLLRLIQLWQNFQETALSLERLGDILDTPQEADKNDRQNIPMPDIQGAIKFDRISFRFAKSPNLQLDQVSVEIPAGAFVGIVGQSGAGKSTLTKLVPRLYDPEAGRILVDGYDIHKVELYSLRRQIGMVLQDTLLFDTTVQENIALTNPDAPIDAIIHAAQVANAHDFIMSLPQGYNTRVGERGAALSGGQRQRLAIARSVLQNPRLLILDEATSALDYNTERQVCLNLQAEFRGTTALFITHRLATVRNADLILMMDRGQVVEQGTHDQLIEMKGMYYCLYQQQEAIGT
jgi:HlyB family type I secretion system ABC transporter